MPLNFSNRSAIRFMISWSAAVSSEGKNRYQRPNCSLSAAVLKPIVEVESVAKAGSGVARIRVRAQRLKTMRKTLFGAQQQPLVGRAARSLHYVDGPERADRPWIIRLSAGTSGNHRAADAVEVIQVDGD